MPLAYFQVEPLNIVLSDEMEGTKYQELSFHWVPLSQIINPKFYEHYLSAFNFQVISYCAEKITSRLYDPKIQQDISSLSFYPHVAVLNCES